MHKSGGAKIKIVDIYVVYVFRKDWADRSAVTLLPKSVNGKPAADACWSLQIAALARQRPWVRISPSAFLV